jgi:hypothetical protein
MVFGFRIKVVFTAGPAPRHRPQVLLSKNDQLVTMFDPIINSNACSHAAVMLQHGR